MVYKFFDKKFKGSGITFMSNQQFAEEKKKGLLAKLPTVLNGLKKYNTKKLQFIKHINRKY